MVYTKALFSDAQVDRRSHTDGGGGSNDIEGVSRVVLRVTGIGTDWTDMMKWCSGG